MPVNQPPQAASTPLSAAEAAPPGASGKVRRLRVGVMLNGWTDRAWVARVIEDIQRGDVAEVTTVVIDRSPPASFAERLKAHLSVWLFSLYYRLDRWIFRRLLKVRYDAFEPVDLRPLLKDATVLEVVPLRKKFT